MDSSEDRAGRSARAGSLLTDEVYLSVVIPAYNEQARIADTLLSVKAFLQQWPHRSEVIVVDDGSRDLTLEVVKTIDISGQILHEQETTRITTDVTNRGKGEAVRRGLLLAKGTNVLFSDADLSTPIEEVEKLLVALEAGADIAIGSRRLPTSEVDPQPAHRRLMGWVFSTLVRTLAVPGVQDSQCGFKCYRRAAAQQVAKLQKMPGFSFDVEHLFLARRLGLRVTEIGVRWKDAPGTKVKPIRDSWRMLRDLFRIRWAHRGVAATSA
jgi:dolichyl-phosphate beta-glucosyltransferase